jgi:hypothetical protein
MNCAAGAALRLRAVDPILARWALWALLAAPAAPSPSGTPTAEVAVLESASPGDFQEYGRALAAAGELLVIGEPGDDATGPESGAAFVYAGAPGGWQHLATLHSPAPSSGARFGAAVATDGLRVAVGAPRGDSAQPGSGAVHVWRRTPQGMALEASLGGSQTDSFCDFGSALALSGRTLAAGAPRQAASELGILGQDAGAAYVFELGTSGWSESAMLRAEQPSFAAYFGSALALDAVAPGAPGARGAALRLAVGSPGADYPQHAGAVDCFALSGAPGAAWTFEQRLLAPAPAAADDFGRAVALSDRLLAVGAPGSDSAAANAGAVHVFGLGAQGWVHAAELVSPAPLTQDYLGSAVTFEGPFGAAPTGTPIRLAAGAPQTFYPPPAKTGHVVVWRRTSGGFAADDFLEASNAQGGNELGSALAFGAHWLVAGAPGEPEHGVQHVGAALLFAP